jgi:hypothetical protein
LELPNAGCDGAVVVADDTNENMGVEDAPLDNPNTDALLVLGVETVDAPNEIGLLLVVGAETEAIPNTLETLLEVATEAEDAPNDVGVVLVAAEAEDTLN